MWHKHREAPLNRIAQREKFNKTMDDLFAEYVKSVNAERAKESKPPLTQDQINLSRPLFEQYIKNNLKEDN